MPAFASSPPSLPPTAVDVIIIGGGQAGLATAFYLRRSGLSYLMLDHRDAPGGAWLSGWDSLHLFSPAQWSSLPGWLMPKTAGEYPTLSEAIAYLTAYEHRYAIPVERPVTVTAVHRTGDAFTIDTTRGQRTARAIVNATGQHPVIPKLPGHDIFQGRQLHASEYRSPDRFAGKRVVVVGGGNSGAQLYAELVAPDSGVAHVTWATQAPPTFLPDHVDGRYLFDQATARYKALQEGRTPDPPRSLGDIVMVAPVRAARDRNVLHAVPMFTHMTPQGVVWPDGTETQEDVILWCTGFRPNLDHLRPLGITPGHVNIRSGSDTHSADDPMIWLVGYGNWTGYASATLIGVGRSARSTVAEITAALSSENPISK